MLPAIISLQEDYKEKKQEIDSFFSFVYSLDKKHNIVLKSVDLTVLKAACLLVLYNIVEPTVNSLVKVLLDSSKDNIRYTNLHSRIKNLWLTQQKDGIRKCHEDKVIQKLKSVIDICSNERIIDISTDSFIQANKEKSSYGFPTIHHIFECFNIKLRYPKSAKFLNNLCDKRNQLAHGVRRYQDVGSEMTVQELKTLKKHCYQILDSLFLQSDKIIQEKTYLKTLKTKQCHKIQKHFIKKL